MNKPIKRVAAALGVLLAALFVNLNVIQVVKGDNYRDHSDNKRVLLYEYAHPRGQIVVGGTAVAYSVKTKDELTYLRKYVSGPVYAPVVGYYSFVYGTSGIESAENSLLSGADDRLFGNHLSDLFTGRNPTGGTVDLTINKFAQQAAYAAMKGSDGQLRKGAIVALDPSTGAILAAVSTPSFDPSVLSSHNADDITAAYAKLLKDPDQPLNNRAFGGYYAPGSVFKVVVSAAALKLGFKPDTSIYAPLGFRAFDQQNGAACGQSDGPCVSNFEGENCGDGRNASLALALAKSCNTAFAALAVQKIGGRNLSQEAQLFGFDSNQIDTPLAVQQSTIGSQADLNDKAALAQTAFGQRDVRISPVQGAMIASAVANDGRLMKPYLIADERSPNLSVLTRTEPKQLSTVLDPTLNASLQNMMVGVVTSGTGTAAAIPGYTVAGKTGTADTGYTSSSGQPANDWFVGYAAKDGKPLIAVAVVIEGGNKTGGETSAPAARQVMEAYLKATQ